MSEQFGDRLYKLRKESGLTQDEMVEQMNARFDAGLNKSIVSRYENNIHKPSKFTLVQHLADFFGVTPDYLMGLSNEKYTIEKIKDDIKRVPILGMDKYEYVVDHRIDFGLYIKGDSMIGARIFDGDLVLVSRQSDVEHGEIAALSLDGEIAIKRIYKYGNKIILHSENPTILDTTYNKNDKNLTILGKVQYVKFETR